MPGVPELGPKSSCAKRCGSVGCHGSHVHSSRASPRSRTRGQLRHDALGGQLEAAVRRMGLVIEHLYPRELHGLGAAGPRERADANRVVELLAERVGACEASPTARPPLWPGACTRACASCARRAVSRGWRQRPAHRVALSRCPSGVRFECKQDRRKPAARRKARNAGLSYEADWGTRTPTPPLRARAGPGTWWTSPAWAGTKYLLIDQLWGWVSGR
jgi:hypothetical protein